MRLSQTCFGVSSSYVGTSSILPLSWVLGYRWRLWRQAHLMHGTNLETFYLSHISLVWVRTPVPCHCYRLATASC